MAHDTEIIDSNELKRRLRSLDEFGGVQIGRETFPVGQWTHLAADLIDNLEQALAQRDAWLRSSCRPIRRTRNG